jgi:hydrogenase expression/formation protein
VTNGGIRGDAKEISYTAGVKLVFEEEKMRQLVNPRVLEMLEALEIDYLGVSIDALLIIAPPEEAEKIKRAIRDSGVAVDEIGTVEAGKGALLRMDGRETDFSPRFREAAYTPIKKAVGQDAQRDVAEMTRRVDEAAENAVEKKRRFIEKIRKS